MRISDIFKFLLPEKADKTAVKNLTDNFESLDSILGKTPETINGIPVTEGTRDIKVDEVPLADNLTSDKTQYSEGSFVERTTGGTAPIEDGEATMLSIVGNSVHTGYVPEILTVTVSPVEREEGEMPITADFDADVFKSVVTTSGTTIFIYTSGEWNLTPETYGLTIVGDPVNGDSITIVYVVEERGTISVATPTSFNSTGWNLYDNSVGYAKVVKYSDDYGFGIDGNYSSIAFSETPDGAQTPIFVVDDAFIVPGNGYVHVTGGDSTTCIYATWSDWIGYHPETVPYADDAIDLTSVMAYFSAGLCKVGDVHDEINLMFQTAVSRIQRLTYSKATIEALEEAGRAYEADENYIYAVRTTPVTYDISVDGMYEVNDHGIEFFDGTIIAPFVTMLYGNNLKNKLEVDVVTKSQDIVNNLSSTATNKALSANMGNFIGQIMSGITTYVTGNTNNSGKTINSGDYFIANGTTYKATASIPVNAAWAGSVSAVSNDLINGLNSNLTHVYLGQIQNSAVSAGSLSLYKLLNFYALELSSLTLATSLNAGASVIIGNIPSEHRPSVQQNGYGIGVSGGNVHMIRTTVNTNGDVQVTNLGTTGSRLYSDGQLIYLKH